MPAVRIPIRGGAPPRPMATRAAELIAVHNALGLPIGRAESVSEQLALEEAAPPAERIRGVLRRWIGAIDLGAADVAERHDAYLAGTQGPAAH